MKVCRKCGCELIEGSNWYESNKKNYQYICIECDKARSRRQYKENPPIPSVRKVAVCEECKEEKLIRAKGLCYPCYEKSRAGKLVICESCGKRETHYAKGLCHRCYSAEWSRGRGKKPRGVSADYRKRWRQNNREKIRQYKNRRRASKMGVVLGKVGRQFVFDLYDNKCIYCGGKEGLSLDHIVPLSKGGKHVEENLVVACKSCNSSKGNRSLLKWLQTQPYSQVWLM